MIQARCSSALVGSRVLVQTQAEPRQQIFTGMNLTLRNRPDVIVFSFIGVAMRLEPGIVDLTLE
ncbi:MAG: hypothetical protein DME81_01820 [Verrucomicrobia bacterium]|nr:MAG: hypothetical protein DME81_01820 [Verrucomicrobiota bacterium]